MLSTRLFVAFTRAASTALLLASVVAAGLLLAPDRVTAQNNSVLLLLPTDGRRLQLGGEHRGALSSSDPLSVYDNFLEAWDIEGEAGTRLFVDLESTDFDPVLFVVGPGFAETIRDDDSGGGCNARVDLTFLESGTFRVVASASGMRETGTYTLTVSDQPSAAPTYGCGEANPAELLALPTEGRSLRIGDEQSSQLSAFAQTVQDGRPAEAWTLEGNAGDRVSISLVSAAFDSYLYLLGPGMDMVLTDDDGAGDLDSQIDTTLPETGSYTVVASALGAGSSGSYRIRVGEPLDLSTLDTGVRTIDLGQTVFGLLTTADPVVVDGRQGQAWAFEGAAGTNVTVDLVSEDFDSYLYVAGPGLMEALFDDDSGGDLHSRITLTLPESGTYRIIASALSAGSTGEFQLSVRPSMELR